MAPPPRLPHPPARPLAVPTTGAENMELIQNWVETKVASENPAKKRTKMKEVGEAAAAAKKTAGAVRRESEAEARRGPMRSQAVPMARRAKTAPETEAIPALPMSVAVRLRLSRMMGRRGGAAKVETKQQKKLIHERWKALMWGAAIENSLNSVALCSEFTGRANFVGPIDSSLLEISILLCAGSLL